MKVLLKSDRNNGCFTRGPIHFLSLAHFVELEMFQTIFAQKKPVLYSLKFVVLKLCSDETMWKNIVEPGRTQMTVPMTHAHCMLDTKGYKDTLRICNTSCISMVRVFTRTRSVFVMCMLPVLFEIAVVYPTSPLITRFPSRDGQNWIQCDTLRGREHLSLISEPTEKRNVNRPER
jgi:hypothetical protein